MGGDTLENNYTSTLEMITSSDLTCVPNMPGLPVGKQAASAVLLGSSIFHCGGFDGVAAWEYEGTCFSVLLGRESSSRWEVEEGHWEGRRRIRERKRQKRIGEGGWGRGCRMMKDGGSS